jgi:hypothetical protein
MLNALHVQVTSHGAMRTAYAHGAISGDTVWSSEATPWFLPSEMISSVGNPSRGYASRSSNPSAVGEVGNEGWLAIYEKRFSS